MPAWNKLFGVKITSISKVLTVQRTSFKNSRYLTLKTYPSYPVCSICRHPMWPDLGLAHSISSWPEVGRGLTLAQHLLSTAPGPLQLGCNRAGRARRTTWRLLPARLGQHDNGPTAALEGGLHGADGGGFCGVAGNGCQAAEFLK